MEIVRCERRIDQVRLLEADVTSSGITFVDIRKDFSLDLPPRPCFRHLQQSSATVGHQGDEDSHGKTRGLLPSCDCGGVS